MIELMLPYPPSANRYWRHPTTGKLAGRHLLSAEGRTYREDVHGAVLLQLKRYPRLSGRLSVRWQVYPPDRRRRDLDNVLKGAQDALTHAQVWLDDEQIDRFEVWRLGPMTLGGLRVQIEEISG